MPPIVSVVIPYSGQREAIASCLKTVGAQNCEPLEIVIVADEAGKNEMQELTAQFNDVVMVTDKHARVISVARNLGVRASKGDLILTLNSEDLLAPNFLQSTLVKLLENPDIDAVYTDVEIPNSSGQTWQPQHNFEEILCNGCPDSFLFRRKMFDAVGGYKEHLTSNETPDFWLTALELDCKFDHVHQPLLRTRPKNSADEAEDRMRVLIREHKENCLKSVAPLLLSQAKAYQKQLSEYQKMQAQQQQLYDEVQEQYQKLSALGEPLDEDKDQTDSILKKVRSLLSEENPPQE